MSNTNGLLLIGGTSGPTAATLTAGDNITITNTNISGRVHSGITIESGSQTVNNNTISSELTKGTLSNNANVGIKISNNAENALNSNNISNFKYLIDEINSSRINCR